MSFFDFQKELPAREHPAYLGTVNQVDTRRVVIAAENDHLDRAIVGGIVALPRATGDCLIGMVDRIVRQSMPLPVENDGAGDADDLTLWEQPQAEVYVSKNTVTVTLVGRVSDGRFSRSLTAMPDIGGVAYMVKGEHMNAFMRLVGGVHASALKLGHYALDETAAACLDGNKLFQRHAALLGSTGSGKSWTVATILERAAELPSANIVVLDLHGEYRNLPYADQLKIPGPDEMDGEISRSALFLPYWLMNAEELISMFIDATEFSAHNQTLVFQDAVVTEKKRTLNEEGHNEVLSTFTVDSPVPFSLENVVYRIKALNEQMVQGSRGPKKGDFNGQFSRLLARIGAKLNDRRYGFLFHDDPGLHTYEAFHVLASKLMDFTAERGRARVKVIDFSEVPADVLPVVLGIVARLTYYFQFWMPAETRHPVAIVCDEAHLYLPRERGNPNQMRAANAFKKIAKEGRKYGVALVIVSQRPSDVDTTILSQCNNVIALRLANTNDVATVKALMPDSMGGFMEMLPALDVGEALVVGDAVLLPSRIRIIPPTAAPLSATIDFWTRWSEPGAAPDWRIAAENMRRQNRTNS